MENQVIPYATTKRLAIYYRYFQDVYLAGEKIVSSKDISKETLIRSHTIRRDFSFFGELGKRGSGYEVEVLLNFFMVLLRDNRLTKVSLVGVGNLGNALIKYQLPQKSNIRISCAFDISEKIVGTVIDDVPVYSTVQLVRRIKQEQIKIAILAVPADRAQQLAADLVKAEVEGILNFTSTCLRVPSSVKVHNVDFTKSLQTLIYFLNS